jgi:two-component system, NtrC family, sensor histidine kinase KinB
MNRENRTSRRVGGFGLPTKLTLGFVSLLAVLIAVGVESISLLDRLGGSIDVILRENYVSVIACERMKESLERMDSGALFALAGEEQQGRALAVEHRPRFEEALKRTLGNITLPGEGERAERLGQLYSTFVPVLERILTPEVPLEQKRALYFQKLYPTFQQIKGTADEILQMNQQNLVEAKDRARQTADAASRRMALLLLAGTAFAGACVFLLSRAILGPLERLTRAAGQIESGNLDLTVSVTSRDEIGQLAAAFNSMAAGLRELRETDQGRLLRARRTSQLAIDDLPEAVAVISPDWKVELANRSASAVLGLRPGEPLPEQHDEWLRPLLDQATSGRLPARGAGEPIRLSVDGRERLFVPRVTALTDGQGRPEGLILVLEDVTDRRRGSEVHAGLLANAARDLERSLDRLRSAPDLGSARAEAERLGELAASLLAMSHLEESRQQLHPEPVSPGDLVAAAVREAAPGYRQEEVKLAADVDPEAPRVLADRERARLVLSSLLCNARTHTPAGGSVTVTARPWEGRVRFAVTDTGSGIPAAQRERIFEPFYQVPGTQDLGDVGLGLAIARNIVQSHGGEIHCESEEGRGTTLWFTLPAAVG